MDHININELTFGYTSEKIIDNLSMSIEQGEVVSISGENGSGKSTLLKLILGELTPQAGSIKLLGKDLSNLKSLKEIGYVPQMQITNQIAFPITVMELVVLGLYSDFGVIKIPRKKHKLRAKELLIEMGLEDYVNTPVNELSGGLRQRAMIARAMINKPKILVLDEPTSGVDAQSKENFLKLIKDMNLKRLLTTIIVSHEIELIKQNLSLDRSYRMINGGVIDAAV